MFAGHRVPAGVCALLLLCYSKLFNDMHHCMPHNNAASVAHKTSQVPDYARCQLFIIILDVATGDGELQWQ